MLLIVVLVLAGACIVAGIVGFLAVRLRPPSNSADTSPAPRATESLSLNLKDKHGELVTTETSLVMIGLGIVLVLIAVFIEISSGEEVADEPQQTIAASTTQPQVVTPTPSAARLPCDGSWVTALGAVTGAGIHPDQFRTDISVQRGDDTLRLLAADSCASLNPGFWIVIGGVYPTSAEAIAECTTRGLADANLCHAVPLTNDASDRSRRDNP